MSATLGDALPRKSLSTLDAVGVVVGLVIGAGIFSLPPLVAANSGSETAFYAIWVAGGVVSLIGALCYCELATAYPSTGGDYHFLQKAFGRPLSFLFAWARIAVITTGSIAVLAYTFGQYASNLLDLGPQSNAIWAALSVLALTAINLAGTRESKNTQNLLTVFEVLGVVAVIVTGLVLAAPAPVPAAAPAALPAANVATALWSAATPTALLFVLFTYGGWNEGAYISAELRDTRSIVIAMALSLASVTALYLLINFAYVRCLGLAGIASSHAVAADVLNVGIGPIGSKVISVIIAISALTSINATILVGARSNYALGRDWSLFAWLGRWNAGTNAPRNSLLAQGAFALVLVVAGAFTQQLETIVNFTMPVFWFFFMLVGVALFVLRAREPDHPRPFKVPLYPLTPVLFILTCAFLLYSSLAFVGRGAWVGVGVVGVGVVLMVLERGRGVRSA